MSDYARVIYLPWMTGLSIYLGPCDKVHDEALRRSYGESDMKGKVGYEADFLAYLERIIRDLDRKIQRGQARLKRSAEAKQQVAILVVSMHVLQLPNMHMRF